MSIFKLEGTPKILVLAPHTDDEVWPAGTIARFIEQGSTVYCACFSPCEESVPEGFDKDVLKREVLDSIDNLGIIRSNFFTFNFRVRHFPAYRQDILEELVKLRKSLRPDLVLLPALCDTHQDHEVVAREGLRAFPHASILGYEKLRSPIASNHACFIMLEERHLAKKIESMKCYRSQAFRPSMSEEALRGLCRVRGLQIAQQAAEAFELLRLVV